MCIGGKNLNYVCTVISVKDIKRSRKFYEEIFGLELDQDYGINISFTCGLALQQDFGWLVGLPEDNIKNKPNNIELCFEEEKFDDFLIKLKGYADIEYIGDVVEHSWGQHVVRFYDPDGHIIEVGEPIKIVVNRFQNVGMSMDQISKRMDVSIEDLEKILNS